MAAPQTPESVEVAGVGAGSLPYTTLSTEQAVRSNSFSVRAKLADETQSRRLVLWVGTAFSPGQYKVINGPWVNGNTGTYTLMNAFPFTPSTEYQVRVFAENQSGQKSSNVDGSVWTNRPPAPDPNSLSPGASVEQAVTSSMLLDWTFTDPDTDDTQTAYEVQYRLAAYGDTPPGSPTSAVVATSTSSHTIAANTFEPFMFYEWRVRLCDGVVWGDFTDWRPFFTTGTIYTPLPLSPSGDSSIDSGEETEFTWSFRSNLIGDVQISADLQYRVVGTAVWTIVPGVVSNDTQTYTFAALTFTPETQYEWQVRTTADLAGMSDWSVSAFFFSVPAAGTFEVGIPAAQTDLTELGCGTYRVFIYDRGGQTLRGEITPIKSLQWNRRRDDISEALLHTNGFDEDCGALLRTVRSWMHELVIFRDNERVWEGPIVRTNESPDGMEIGARDPMVYVYRRIMRMGYNDAYPNLRSVVYRARRIIQDALGYDDPNVLKYLTPVSFFDDAQESRVVAGWSKTAWEEVDDLAANAGLDYTVAGRRIILWDVHRPIGVLPEMRNGDFSDPIQVTEYGMSAANLFAVTNNAGVYGFVQTFDTDPGPYGHIEQIASSYGEADPTTSNALTPAARAALEATLRSQAGRNIANRYPAPVIVRVPDNTTIMPTVAVGINQLVPGVHIPLRSVGVLREVTQIQKLDNVTVTYNAAEQEKIKVTLSPAPNQFTETEPDVVPD